MNIYNQIQAASSPWRDPHYVLTYAEARIAEDPSVLAVWTVKCFRLVFAGGKLDFGEAWDRLWHAAVLGGLDHLVAQEIIGEAVAGCRLTGVAA